MEGEQSPRLPSELHALANLVNERIETLSSGSTDIHAAALNATKFLFDLALTSEVHSIPIILDLLTSLSPSEAPRTRSQARKRKSTSSPPPIPQFKLPVTPLASLCIDGMEEDQIWTQLDLRSRNVCKTLEAALEGTRMEDNEQEGLLLRKAIIDPLKGHDLVGMDMDAFVEDNREDGNSEYDSEESEEDEGGVSDLEEVVEELRDPSSSSDEGDMDQPFSLLDVDSALRDPIARKRKSSELHDDFFDLASFNAETEVAEVLTASQGGLRLGKTDGDSEEDDEGSVDLFAPVDNFDNFDEEDLENNAGETYYNDFFEPPPRKPVPRPTSRLSDATPPKKSGQVRFHEEVRVKSIKAQGKGIPVSLMGFLSDDRDDEGEGEFGEQAVSDEEDGEEEDEEHRGEEHGDIAASFGKDVSEYEAGERETIERLKDDLFAEDEISDTAEISTHEKRMSSLRRQIASLEAENVAKKDWTLMGESSSRGRPENSLLEEDLQFERVMKSVPVTTEAAVLGLEEVIKSRILEGRFDDVVRLRPVDKPFLPSRLFELQDQKSKQSLAQIYEEEYSTAQTGDLAGDDRDGKLKKEHDEIGKLWESICGKLDALCNAHFVPKQPKAIISAVANVSAATLESALPSTKSVSAILAPEEVFAPGSSDPRARSELTPMEKRALRSKDKKAKRKTRVALDKGIDKYAKMHNLGGVKKQKRAALQSVIKSGTGVTIVGKGKGAGGLK